MIDKRVAGFIRYHMIRKIAKLTGCFLLFILVNSIQAQTNIASRLTDAAANIFYQPQKELPFFSKTRTGEADPVIEIDASQRFQTMDGFGFALTGGSALNLAKMSAQARKNILKDLFATGENHIGTSYLRISIGASDLDERPFSYNDLAPGETDTSLSRFDLGYDRKYLLPVLKEIVQINSSIKIMASPWSPPVWMKTNHDTRGGSLLPEYYAAYARYFVKYIRAMKQQGITIDAVTVQNEPLHPGNNPSLLMTADEQLRFVRDYLGPVFRKEKIATKIILYDHNADRPDYPVYILNDTTARKFIDGSAFHLYAGKIEALSKVHEAHPDKNLYFTEQWVGAPGNYAGDIAWHVETLVIGAPRNWCKTVIEWNLASDPQYQPHTDRGGCTQCLGAITIDKDSVKRNPAYYIIAHAAKWVRPGSVRIASAMPDGLPNVAFTTTSGKTVLIVINTSTGKKPFSVKYKGKFMQASLAKGAVATYTW